MTSTPSRALAAALSACLLLPAAAAAADGERTPVDLTADAPARAVEAGPGGGGLVRTIVGLAVVLGVIYGLHWVLKQVKASREDRPSGTALGTLATLPLGPNRSLQLVRAGTEVLLVGVAEHGVTPLRAYSEAQARALGVLVDEGDDGDGAANGDPFRSAAGPRAGRLARLLDALRSRTVIR